MARIKWTAKSRAFQLLEAEASSKAESRDCAVKALALATDIPYDQARAELAALGRRSRRGTLRFDLHEAIKAHGFKLVRIHPSEFIRQYPSPHHNLQNVTTHHPERFNKVWADGHTYLVHPNHHVLVFRNGENLDWTKGKALRVQEIFRIEREA